MSNFLEPSLTLGGVKPLFEKPLYVGRPNDIDKAVFQKHSNESLDNYYLTNNGPKVQMFESQIADYLNVKHCVAINNCTLGLVLLSQVLGLSYGDEIIVPSFTFIASAHAFEWQGLKVKFCDVDPVSHQIDLSHLESLIEPGTKAVLGVHLWGNTCDILALEKICQRYNINLIFDAAHAFGSTYKADYIGRFGSAEVLSFHATKFLSTCEGGAILTQNDTLAANVRKALNFGFVDYDEVVGLGINAKMSELHAAYGLASLEKLEQNLKHLKNNYLFYKKYLQGSRSFKLMNYPENEKRNYQYIVLERQEACRISRNQWVNLLHAENIIARKYFYPGCHRSMPYKNQVLKPLPHTELLSENVLVLPTGTQIGEIEIKRITKLLKTVENEPEKALNYLKMNPKGDLHHQR